MASRGDTRRNGPQGPGDRRWFFPVPERPPEETMSIGALAAKTGVSPRTILYYEELGIYPVPPRTPGGTRRYPVDYRFYLEGAKVLQELGFSLEEIRLMSHITLGEGKSLTSHERAQAMELVHEHMAQLDRKIKVLNALRELLISASRREFRDARRRFLDEMDVPGGRPPPRTPADQVDGTAKKSSKRSKASKARSHDG